MATCTICNSVVPDDAAYCPKCGMKMNRAGDIGPPPTTPAAASPPSSTPPPQAASSTLSERVRDHHEGISGRDTAEKELWTGTFSPKAMIGPMVGGGLISVVLVVLMIMFWERLGAWWWAPLALVGVTWLYLLASLMIRQWSVRYRLTNQRFFHERGLLSRTVDRIEVIDMDDITYTQGIFDRMLGTGTIRITSSDRTHPELQLVGIDDVRAVTALMDGAKREERVRRGLHIEQI